MNNIFKIKKEERLFALVAFLLIVAFNVLMITYHYEDFSKTGNARITGRIFTKNFQVSGFDPYTYLTLSKWKVYYTEYRHPMLPILPLSFLGTQRMADRTHLQKLGDYHRGCDDDFLVHLLHDSSSEEFSER